jgi:hypothetical protein
MAKGHYEVRGYLYLQSSSENSDTVNDIRLKNNAGIFVIEKCTVANSTKGGGTWVEQSTGSSGTSLWTAITATRTGDRTVTVTGDQTAKFKKGMPIRWKEGGVQKWGMVSIASTYSTVTTITFIGCVCASIDEGSFYYSSIIGFEQFKEPFNLAGTVGASGTNIMREFYPMETYYMVGLEFQVGSAGTTGNVTIDGNVDGSSVFSTKPTLGASSAYSTTPFTCNSATIITIGNVVTFDVDAVRTGTHAVNLYIQLYIIPERFFTLN